MTEEKKEAYINSLEDTKMNLDAIYLGTKEELEEAINNLIEVFSQFNVKQNL